MPAVAAAGLDPGLAGGKVQFVVDDDDVPRRKLVEAHRVAEGFAGEIHEGLRLHQQDTFAVDLAFGDLRLEFPRPGGKALAPLNGVDGHEADIVAVAGIFRAGIAKSRDDQHAAKLLHSPCGEIFEWGGDLPLIPLPRPSPRHDGEKGQPARSQSPLPAAGRGLG